MDASTVSQAAADAHRDSWGRVVAALVRLTRDVDIAEEATADAFLLALRTWPAEGLPHSMEAWLLTAARRRAIDRVRRAGRLRNRLDRIAAAYPNAVLADDADGAEPIIADDELRLVVLCCHPALDAEVQVALTMRLACGVSTASIAAAFLVPTTTMAARLTRAKRRIAESGAGIELPDDVAVEERMGAVRRTIHLAYAMGHTAGSGDALRDDVLAGSAHRMARTLHDLRPGDSETAGLLALIELTAARAPARLAATADWSDDGPASNQVLLADMDRSIWDRSLIDSGLRRLTGRAADDRVGPIRLQALIAAEHARAASFAETDWQALIGLYDQLLRLEPSPTVAIGRCLAISYAAGPEAGLQDLDEVIALDVLDRYPYAHAARADVLQRLDRVAEARLAWQSAASCARTSAEREFFARRAGLLG